MSLSFEQGPIRPPSEAASLLLRLTRNCTWNKCAFCRSYQGETFSRRSVEEIKKDIDTVAAMCLAVREKCRGESIDVDVLIKLRDSGNFQMFHIAYWLYGGGKTVFFQDANSLVLPAASIVEILHYMKERLPSVERVTTYARSSTLARSSVEDLTAIGQAGLSRIHVGLESGSDAVLKMINKGTTAKQHVEAGQRVRAAGISLSEYIILGMGGKELGREHSLETAKVLNQIDPNYIRIRSLTISRNTPLSAMAQSGAFQEENDPEIIAGARLLLENLEGIESTVVSDHSLNLLEEVNGKLPEKKADLLAIYDRYLNLSEKDQMIFSLGKRWGAFRLLDDLHGSPNYSRLAVVVDRLQKEGNFRGTLTELKNLVL
jgi:radical SAM superfamily enzyme YgiQ (UPF0313 family)